ncbi:MAG: hypothetical protein QM763_03145 [Agriterribacter sp.]
MARFRFSRRSLFKRNRSGYRGMRRGGFSRSRAAYKGARNVLSSKFFGFKLSTVLFAIGSFLAFKNWDTIKSKFGIK